jgi:metal-responsive CopG/Arc/MetJ family transcriptional regulator
LVVTLTVRLNPKAERALNALAKRRGLSRSEVVREAIERYEAQERDVRDSRRPYHAWLDVIGTVTLAVRDPARTTGAQFTAIVRQRAGARRAR